MRVIINDIDLQSTLNAICLAETISVPPQPKLTYQEVSGRLYGSVDISEVQDGYVCYERREGEIRLLFTGSENKDKHKELTKLIHAKESEIWVSTDADFSYFGRVYVSSVTKYLGAVEVVLSCNLEPYKQRKSTTTTITHNTNFRIEGDVVCYPKITMANISSYSYIQLTDVNSGAFIKVSSPSGNFSSQSISSVVIDFENRHCEFLKSSGTTQNADAYVLITSDYFPIVPNVDTRLNAYPTSATMTFEAVERWL